MAFDKSHSDNRTKSLLTKYDIPISHLSYEYVRSCSNVKELERIVRILRSGEEGFYPNLQKEAEDKLCTLSPNNILLREDVPVLRKESISKQELENMLVDLSNWEEGIAKCDQKLSKEKISVDNEDSLIPIRTVINATLHDQDKTLAAPSTVNKIRDYSSWDKYDVDSELLKMDLEEEKQQEKKQQKKDETKQDRLESIVQQAEKYTEPEREELAEQEITRGNEYYKVGEFNEAIKFYSASIIIWATAKAHNNRAACYLKLHKYSSVIKDTNSVLALEPDNIKALYRRGIAQQKMKLFREALKDINEVLKNQPRNIDALKVAEQLKNEIRNEPKPSTSGSYYSKLNTLSKYNTNGRSDVMRSYPSPTNLMKILEISDNPRPYKKSTRLEIIEVE